MAAEATNGLSAFATLALGAGGAILAIYLKEAVQAAMQRRVIAWQLFGYLMSWRSQIAKHGEAVSVYEKIKARTNALSKAAAHSTAEFERIHKQQYDSRNELREMVKKTLIDALGQLDIQKQAGVLSSTLAGATSASLSEQRRLLSDSKTFISDRDAATLGKAVAMNVVQFRTSLLYLLSALEGAIALLSHSATENSKFIADLVDSLIVNGEDMLVALIRLERNVEVLSSMSLFDLTLGILKER